MSQQQQNQYQLDQKQINHNWGMDKKQPQSSEFMTTEIRPGNSSSSKIYISPPLNNNDGNTNIYTSVVGGNAPINIVSPTGLNNHQNIVQASTFQRGNVSNGTAVININTPNKLSIDQHEDHSNSHSKVKIKKIKSPKSKI